MASRRRSGARAPALPTRTRLRRQHRRPRSLRRRRLESDAARSAAGTSRRAQVLTVVACGRRRQRGRQVPAVPVSSAGGGEHHVQNLGRHEAHATVFHDSSPPAERRPRAPRRMRRAQTPEVPGSSRTPAVRARGEERRWPEWATCVAGHPVNGTQRERPSAMRRWRRRCAGREPRCSAHRTASRRSSAGARRSEQRDARAQDWPRAGGARICTRSVPRGEREALEPT